MLIGKRIPDVTFRTRVRDESIGGPNPFRWEDKTTRDYFSGKRVVLFSLPGAFTPTARLISCRISKSLPVSSRHRASTKSIAFPSTMLLS